ncbi:MAG: hypothetical protein GY736_05885 [Sphingomonas sp.]|uniref:hypothetical protein n=1 Tax=Sphingomonas sp. TaxID=28214 RepID=UPI00258583E2|nr:hypothetical protein [Sphingomonas sp.]MCP4025829.1 hypothetical protein [Sphingomonas sp.]
MSALTPIDGELESVFTAQITEIRTAALARYGRYSESLERAQRAQAVMRFLYDDPHLAAITDRLVVDGAWVDRVDASAVPSSVTRAAAELLDGADPNTLGVGVRAAIGRAIRESATIAGRSRYGVLFPRQFRDLAPHGTVAYLVQIQTRDATPKDEQNDIYWWPHPTGPGVPPIPPVYLGTDIFEFRTILSSLSTDYGVDDYAAHWYNERGEASAIMGLRIFHTISSAILAMIPVTAPYAASAYAAGNALLEMWETGSFDSAAAQDALDAVRGILAEAGAYDTDTMSNSADDAKDTAGWETAVAITLGAGDAALGMLAGDSDAAASALAAAGLDVPDGVLDAVAVAVSDIAAGEVAAAAIGDSALAAMYQELGGGPPAQGTSVPIVPGVSMDVIHRMQAQAGDPSRIIGALTQPGKGSTPGAQSGAQSGDDKPTSSAAGALVFLGVAAALSLFL